jgi:hypothetical protein
MLQRRLVTDFAATALLAPFVVRQVAGLALGDDQ